MKYFKNVDMKIVKELMNYSNTVSKLYSELYELDIKGKKNSKKYNDFIDFIKTIKVCEMRVYNSIPKNKIIDYIKCILQLEKLSSDIKDPNIKNLFKENENYLTIRVANILEYVLNKNSIKYLDEEENNITSIANNIENFNNDSINVSIIFLDKLIKDIKNSEVKKQLKKAKYINSIFNPNIEDEYLYYNFDLDYSIYDYDEYKFIDYIKEYANEYSKIQISNLLLEENYKDPKKFIIYLSLLKAYLYFSSNDDINKLSKSVRNIKDSNKQITKVKTKIINEMNDMLN